MARTRQRRRWLLRWHDVDLRYRLAEHLKLGRIKVSCRLGHINHLYFFAAAAILSYCHGAVLTRRVLCVRLVRAQHKRPTLRLSPRVATRALAWHRRHMLVDSCDVQWACTAMATHRSPHVGVSSCRRNPAAARSLNLTVYGCLAHGRLQLVRPVMLERAGRSRYPGALTQALHGHLGRLA